MRQALLALAVVALVTTTAHANAWKNARPSDPDWTIAFSPYHLLWPTALFSLDYRLHEHGSLALELGAGSFRQADAFVAGVRLPLYVWGDFRFAFFLAPSFRAIVMQVRDERSTAPPAAMSVRNAIGVVSFDLEHARSNASSALVPGLWGGARYVGPFGITLQGAFGLHYSVPVMSTAIEPHPDAYTTPRLWPMFLLELGYTF